LFRGNDSVFNIPTTSGEQQGSDMPQRAGVMKKISGRVDLPDLMIVYLFG